MDIVGNPFVWEGGLPFEARFSCHVRLAPQARPPGGASFQPESISIQAEADGAEGLLFRAAWVDLRDAVGARELAAFPRFSAPIGSGSYNEIPAFNMRRRNRTSPRELP